MSHLVLSVEHVEQGVERLDCRRTAVSWHWCCRWCGPVIGPPRPQPPTFDGVVAVERLDGSPLSVFGDPALSRPGVVDRRAVVPVNLYFAPLPNVLGIPRFSPQLALDDRPEPSRCFQPVSEAVAPLEMESNESLKQVVVWMFNRSTLVHDQPRQIGFAIPLSVSSGHGLPPSCYDHDRIGQQSPSFSRGSVATAPPARYGPVMPSQ